MQSFLKEGCEEAEGYLYNHCHPCFLTQGSREKCESKAFTSFYRILAQGGYDIVLVMGYCHPEQSEGSHS